MNILWKKHISDLCCKLCARFSNSFIEQASVLAVVEPDKCQLFVYGATINDKTTHEQTVLHHAMEKHVMLQAHSVLQPATFEIRHHQTERDQQLISNFHWKRVELTKGGKFSL